MIPNFQQISFPPEIKAGSNKRLWTSEEVRHIEGRSVLALPFKYMPKLTMEDMENISNDTGYPFEFVIDSYCKNKNSGRANVIFFGNNAIVDHLISKPGLPEAHSLSNTRDSAYGPQMERKNFAQPVAKRVKLQRDPNLPAAQAVDDSRQNYFHRCGLCNQGFARQADLRRHLNAHFPGEFHCPYPGCDKSFKRKDHLNNHCEKNHRDSSSSAP